jgi:predicted membrane-bound mannosyltransferase/DNA-binding beta-propeller fold protein YncE
MTEPTPTQPTATDFLSRPILSTTKLDWEKGIYILFILIALFTRFYDLGSRVVSHDESLHTHYSYAYYAGSGYEHTPLMHGPSLFHATALSYWLFGADDYAARIPVALLGVFLVFMPYLLRDWIGRPGALIASFLLLISPYITYYSRYIRHDIYIIVFAAIVFTAILYYMRQREDKYLWWFAIGMGLMFTTMETSFIYVAIFGSFLALRQLYLLLASDWLWPMLPQLRQSALLVGLALLMLLTGLGGQYVLPRVMNGETAVTPQEDDAVFAIDPTAPAEAVTTEPDSATETVMRWLQIVGIGVLSAGLFMAAHTMGGHLRQYAEFDLIVLFTSLTLPTASPILVYMAGWNPLDYSVGSCLGLSLGECSTILFNSGLAHSGLFLIITLTVSVSLGLWWDTRRWLIAAAIFHGIFIVLFTSIFSNPGGWASGMVGSLGYWLEQHGVERGSQPRHYYLFVTTIYEFLPILFALLASRLWLKRQRMNQLVGYWVTAVLLALLSFSLVRWYYNIRHLGLTAPDEHSWPGWIAALVTLITAGAIWFFYHIAFNQGKPSPWDEKIDGEALFGLVPFLVWWTILSWIGYSIAGEKMPWLSSHFVTPMVLLSGWYFSQRLQEFEWQALWSRQGAALVGLTAVFIVTLFLTIAPVWNGQIQFGTQLATALSGLGRFLGGLLVLMGLIYFIMRLSEEVDPAMFRFSWTAGLFIVLSLTTMRATYMAAFPNADYATEYMVYAHGAPGTKSVAMQTIDDLSIRLHGDKSMIVAYDDVSSWPMTWYLRDYPNRIYFGGSPGMNITDAPVVIAGDNNWGRVEAILGDDYDQVSYTFLWWPMEQYRFISWNAIFGDHKKPVEIGDHQEPTEARRGLGNANVRQALWNIFFYRDYTKYNEVFGRNFTLSEWELRRDLRLYVRKDVTEQMWDYGAAIREPIPDPYAENELDLTADLAISQGDGPLNAPRNIAVAANGDIYVADSGNHRVQVFDRDGRYLRGWGGFGGEQGQFNEPWGIAVDDQFVYVADTWNHRIQKFSHNGQFILSFGVSGVPATGETGAGLFFGPRDIVILRDGTLAVTDTGNHRLQLFDADGNFRQQIGFLGAQMGQFYEPVSIAIGPDGFIYVADAWNQRVQSFTSNLFPFLEWPVNGWRSETIYNKPYIAVDAANRIYVTDPEAYRIIVFDAAGNYLARFGRFGADMSSFGLPNGLAVDPDGFLYVADADNHRILRFPPILGPIIPIDTTDPLAPEIMPEMELEESEPEEATADPDEEETEE